jgi:hypothetical protein
MIHYNNLVMVHDGKEVDRIYKTNSTAVIFCLKKLTNDACSMQFFCLLLAWGRVGRVKLFLL